MSEHLAEIFAQFGSGLLETQQEQLQQQIDALQHKHDLITQELARRTMKTTVETLPLS